MSVAEFAIATTAAVPLIFATHECIRLYSIHRSAQVVLYQHLSKTSLSSLAHIKKGTFSGSQKKENTAEQQLKNDLTALARVPVLQWRWNSLTTEGLNPLLSIRVSMLGPSLQEPFHPVQAQVTLCVQSWLEPLLRIAVDGRSCVGEYLSNSEKRHATGRGVALKLAATRFVPMTVYVFHRGIYQYAKPGRSPY